MDKCCLNIDIYKGEDGITLALTANYDEEGVFISYTFFHLYVEAYRFVYDEITSTWFFYLGIDLIASYEGLDENCPQSYSEDWTYEGRIQFSFILYAVECNHDNNDIPADVEPINCDIPCTNGNLLKKQKASLAADIADISKREVFGLKCNDNWENIFMRSLIIDALSCLPYGIYSKDEEQCLIGNLTDNCNC
jgi:hypothetical protein